MRYSAALPHTPADIALVRLSRWADKGRLWWFVAALLAIRKGPSRRAALRGLAALGIASAVANLVGKPLLPRRRPAAEAVPEVRRLRIHPTSSSFPSGHAASAAAFVTAAALESPRLGAALIPLGTAVAYSRLHTGVHWPSDIGAGAALGAFTALATRHWWPPHPDARAHTTHPADAPALPEGERVLTVVNRSSGTASDDPTPTIRARWPRTELLHTEPGTELRLQLTEELRHHGGRIRALGAAGGDGTVAAVAAVAADHGLPLALIPTGTLNHFARDLGIRDLADTDVAIRAGSAVGIDLGEVEVDTDHDTVRRQFINTASLGGYPEMVRLRETIERHHPRWPSAIVAMARTLRHARPLRIRLNGEDMLVWLLFVGNGTYAPKGVIPSHRPALDTGLLDVRYLRADKRYSRTRFLLAVVTNTLATSHVYAQRDLAEVDVVLLDGNRRIATDGEVGPLGHRFRFRSRPSALSVYRPRTPTP
ncbi:bifunctional phosphatase PAP2/diacylglycerol kinase family protein [Saccharomonospora viridis]|jgi:diacylglycerol kinase family enzyme/membrane-associated phospholipid phosphatase|uniref:Sphingosine/diacylglycerol kinase-like enzyme n=3 Tax=Saccharomonospora viridis TaxID=1852 RepID=C7MWV4_SACVD|nr:bifunctional phosphatase PAP2/diacylglycerol kinase family protein [Saccharomonospora viridis]ACU97208.1 sphingosine/diacylglycerol kinase-like enzyme [Saccharomonospora viridis DSM 43017]KHF43469.1 glycerophosphatase [Saccharomonospora viridis]SFO78555.1 undecaprenyl-diphosphatase [Saccharomonospora viridis]